MNFTQTKPDFTKISLGQYRIADGNLEELVLHIQHRKIGYVEPFCREVWKEIKLNNNDLIFETSDDKICIFSWNNCRRMLYQRETYFMDGKGFISARVILFVANEVIFSTAYITIEGFRIRAK
jgi:hypothetical protein